MPQLGEKVVTDRQFNEYLLQLESGQLITEYPKMLYRSGEQMIVDDAEAEIAAMAEGWDASPVTPAPTKAKRETSNG